MNKAVYAYLLDTFGRKPGYWLGVTTSLIRSLLLRIYATYLAAQMAGSLATGDLTTAQSFAWLFFWWFSAGIVIGAIGDLIAARAEDNTWRELSTTYYQKLTSKDMSFYRDHQTGYLTSLFRQHLDSAFSLVRMFRGDTLRIIISLVVPTAVLLTFNVNLGVTAIAIIVVQIVYIMWASKLANKYREASHEIYRKVTGEVADSITNIIAFKSSGKEQANGIKVAGLINQETEAFWRRQLTFIAAETPRALLTVAGTTVGFLVVLLNKNDSAPSEVIALIVMAITFIFQIVRTVNEIPNLLIQHDDYITKLHPTLKYLTKAHQAIADPARPHKLQIKNGAITITDVSFSYEAGKKSITVFDKLNLTITGGEKVGIVGLSGAGKSTLANLLVRFDDVQAGAICIDGTDIRTVRQSELRQNIAYVPQEPLLFHRTIRENITYFNPQASQQKIQNAATAAHAHDFISRLPDGYNTIVGERGIKLSGGQKQRIVIARAILKNAPIIIFDEATSALDSESEHLIQQALPQIIGKHTAIVIAHRLSTVARLDRIIVMHNGKVAEDGDHQQLLEKRGHYFKLWQKQTKH